MPDVDFMNKPVFTIFDTDSYYQSKYPSGGDEQDCGKTAEEIYAEDSRDC